MKKVSFLGKRIVVFTAHPDDEQLAAGTMYENYKAGGTTFLICATSGEKGKSHLAKTVLDATLGRIREKELLKAAKTLRVDKVFFLHFPDGKVRENEKKLYEKSVRLIRKLRPDQMLAFGPDGISAHWDHVVSGRVALRIARTLKVPLAAFTLSDEMILARMKKRKFFLARRKFGVYAGVPQHRKADVSIKINLGIKRKAMAFHVSQFGKTGQTPFAQLPRPLAEKAFGHEHFVIEKV